MSKPANNATDFYLFTTNYARLSVETMRERIEHVIDQTKHLEEGALANALRYAQAGDLDSSSAWIRESGKMVSTLRTMLNITVPTMIVPAHISVADLPQLPRETATMLSSPDDDTPYQ